MADSPHNKVDVDKTETRVETRHVADDSPRSTKVDGRSQDDLSGSQSPDTFNIPGPPPLNYTVRTKGRERYIIIFFMLIFFETGVLPLILFYSLRWGAHLSVTKNLAIITSLIGTVSGFKLAQRSFGLLFRNGHESRRPIGAGRWGVDAFHVLINIALFAFFVPLIIGSSLTPANVSTVAMALPCFMLTFCVPLLITGIWDRHIRLPIRVSSLPPHELLPPLTYTITEDVVSVDGSGGLMFRQAWRHRYEASRVMRRVCRVTAVVWGATGCTVATVLIIAAWTAPTDTAYGLGYGIPWLWAIVTSTWTIHYVHRSLDRERREWDSSTVHKEVELHLQEKELDREVDLLQRMRSIASAEIDRDEFDRLVREGRERRERREMREKAKGMGGGERALSDPSATSGGGRAGGEGGPERNDLRRPRTLSPRLHSAANQV
ncbi:hypothetical protein BC835DRAFT_1290728 [Cytidiella melzeri]|nr:hypothetical protein BC835DRAFT_1290728 [Cytidiella melzeri]